MILEVIACSVSDAIEAQKGGASRLELVRDLDRGGLTPSIDLVREIKNAVDLPLRVMVRESDGFTTSSEREVERLGEIAAELSELGVDGLVIGFLKGDRIDFDLTARVLACAPALKATFHHAFEAAGDQLQALRDIKTLSQVDRILSSGGAGEWEARMQRLDDYSRRAAPEIKIIAGGGIAGDEIAGLRRSTRIREFHVGRAARRGFSIEDDVAAELVHKLVLITQN